MSVMEEWSHFPLRSADSALPYTCYVLTYAGVGGRTLAWNASTSACSKHRRGGQMILAYSIVVRKYSTVRYRTGTNSSTGTVPGTDIGMNVYQYADYSNTYVPVQRAPNPRQHGFGSCA